MSKHYFKLTDGKYGVILSTEPTVDLDEIVADFDPKSIYKVHEVDKYLSLMSRRGYNRAWSGILQYDRYILTYIIAEERILQLSLISVLVMGCPSKEELGDKVNEILNVFGLREVSSQREAFEREILTFEKYPYQ